MLVLGISGGPSLIFENQLNFDFNMFHDSAAVLIEDGKVLAAIEEERLNRIKHTNKAPIMAIKACLEKSNKKIEDIDKLAVYFDYKTYNKISYKLEYRCLNDYKDYINRFLKYEFNSTIKKEKIEFVPHHFAHAESAYQLSGFNEALIVTLDGAGDNNSGVIISKKNGQSELLNEFSISDSLGLFYLDITRFLGYDLFDEYKIMGLSSYGDPSVYRNLFKRFYKLLPNGDYSINHIYLQLLNRIIKPRNKDEELSQIHMDIAAALQETLETIVLHILTQYQKSTGHSNLCLAGGVAHNCSCNGKIVYSNIFESVFVQPASHDAGCALGAALYVTEQKELNTLEHIYWGTMIGSDSYVNGKLKNWGNFLNWEHMTNSSDRVAQLLANNNIVAWVQGCSEFGPRALGNRSILADPRPVKNKSTINSIIKKRESYRPFAPAIMVEYLDEFFQCPNTKCDYSFMNYTLSVKERKIKQLGAVTHIDGTARLQTVSKKTNPKFWNLINSFNKITGTPVLLNTSFNNYSEPIVNSVDDAITCFLTSKIDYLVINDYLIWKKNLVSESDYFNLRIRIPKYIQLIQLLEYSPTKSNDSTYIIKTNFSSSYSCNVSEKAFRIMKAAFKNERTISEIIGDSLDKNMRCTINELMELWEKRLIILEP